MTRVSFPEPARIRVPTPFSVGPVNVFLIKADSPILIDTGPNTDAAYRRLLEGLHEHGVALRDIRLILLTHSHLDHAGMLTRIQTETDARVCAHPQAADQFARYDESLEEHCAFLRQAMSAMGAPHEAVETAIQYQHAVHYLGGAATIHHPLRDGQEIGGMQARFVPGHSTTDVLYYAPGRKIAFTGDHIIKNMCPNPLLHQNPPPGPKSPLAGYIESLTATRALDIAACHPGHGSPYADHRTLIDAILVKYDERLQQVAGLLEEQPQSPYQFMTRMFPNLGHETVQFALSLTAVYLDALARNGRAQAEVRNGVVLYRK